MEQLTSGDFTQEQDPFALFQSWLEEAKKSEPNDPNAMALSTVDADGLPNSRMVLLNGRDGEDFVFYTNTQSQKGTELLAQPKAALLFHWKSLRRQVRVRGHVVRSDGAAADAYFASRSLQSRLGAWASQQSRPLESRGTLMAEVAKITARLGPRPPRPEFWGGYDIFPSQMEFWADGAFRLHDRYRWKRPAMEDEWEIQRLYP